MEKTQQEIDQEAGDKIVAELEAEQKRLDEIAAKYGVKKVFEITAFNDDDVPVTAVFKKPTRNILSAALSQQERDPMGAKEIVLKNCFLEGDKRIYTDDEFFMSACTKVDDLITFRKAEVKKN